MAVCLFAQATVWRVSLQRAFNTAALGTTSLT